MAWLYLGIAIIAEVLGTTALKYCEGFTKLTPSVLVIIGYAVSFYCLSKVLNQIPVSIAYAVWSGAGVALVGFISWIWLDQKLDTAALIGIGLIILGVIVINLFSTVTTH